MGALLKLVAVLTILWGGWMYFKNSSSETELRKVSNEFKVARGEMEEAQTSYDAEVKKRDALTMEISALQEQKQQLEEDIKTKIKEKSERAAQDLRNRMSEKDAREAKMAEEKAALEAAREAKTAEEKAAREAAREAKMEEERAAREAERQERLAQEEAKRKATEAERKAKWESKDLENKIERANDTLRRCLKCRADRPDGVQDLGRIDGLKRRWSSNVQACIKAANDGNEKKLKLAAKALETTADALNRPDGQNEECLGDAAEAIEAANVILKAKKRLKELNQGR